MKILKNAVILIGVYFCLSSCSTTIKDQSVINDLTTCRHGSIEKVKKNLILMGYEVEESEDQLLTSYKQEGTKLDGSQIFKKINVIKTGPNSIRFKVLERRSYKVQEAEDQYVLGVDGGSYGAPKYGRIQAGSYKTVTKNDDHDSVYYNKRIDTYKAFRDQVCGTM